MQIQLVPGDYLWSSEGTHVCDANGFAIVVSEEVSVEVDDAKSTTVWTLIQSDRVARGVDPATGLKQPDTSLSGSDADSKEAVITQ
ncbi:hypothetical protein UFOVP244_160 [uncultured Caudovirales phage]|uniref:Uncharacterized protein n=1 Tax=uncultured Caudovirales phage TaxID=2100421 RepID=A0A6J7WXI2_9CAUD|nr:hypothetical protein UFOVP244_160 [uncultured Caudovirales phage]